MTAHTHSTAESPTDDPSLVNKVHLKFRTSYLILLGLLLIGLLVSSIGILRQSHINNIHKTDADRAVSQVICLSAVVHELQKERGLSALYLGPVGDHNKTQLYQQRELTDQKRAQVELCIPNRNSLTKRQSALYQTIQGQMLQLGIRRSRVTSREITTAEMIEFYTDLNDSLLKLAGLIAKECQDSGTSKNISVLMVFLREKELAGIERAILSSAYSAKQFSPRLYEHFSRIVNLQNALHETFTNLANAKITSVATETLSAPEVFTVERLRKAALNAGPESELTEDANHWFEVSTSRINLMKSVEDYLTAYTLEKQQEEFNQSRELFYFSLLYSAGLLGLCIGGGYFCLRNHDREAKAAASKLSELAEGDAMSKALLNKSGDGIVTIDQNGNISMFNTLAEKIFGYASHEVMGKEVEILIPNELRSTHKTILRGVLQSRTNHAVIDIHREVKGLRKDGTIFPAMLTITECRTDDQIVYAAMIRDISEERETERKLQQNFATLEHQNWVKTEASRILGLLQGVQSLQKSTQTVISELAPLLSAGAAAFYLLDRRDKHNSNSEEREALILMATYGLEERKSLQDSVNFGEGLIGQCALEKKPICLQEVPPDYCLIQSGVGNQTPGVLVVVPVLFENEVLGVIEVASFTQFDARQQNLLTVICDSLGVIIDSNYGRQVTEQLLERSEKLRRDLKKQQDEISAANESLLEQTASLEQQKRDIEAKNKQIEEAMQRVQTQAEELRLASKYKSEFLANMSHELRTPLNSLLILSKSLMENRERNLTEEQVESARVIYDGGQDLLRLINDILDLSKVEAGMLQVQLENVPLMEVTRSMERQLEHVAIKKGLQLFTKIDATVPSEITTDGMRLEQILKNLLSNAIKFTSQGTVTLQIQLAAKSTVLQNPNWNSQQMLSFSVIDTGIGIPEEQQQAIFEAFQQADGSTTRCFGGTGLGLTISRQLAKLLGGEIQLESQVGQGSTFTLFLPLQHAEKALDDNVKNGSQSDSSLSQIPALSSSHSPNGGSISLRTENGSTTGQDIGDSGLGQKLKDITALHNISATPHESDEDKIIIDDRRSIRPGDKTVLLIEDDEVLAKVLAQQIRQKKYKCLVAGDGVTGLQLADQYNPSCILLDLMIPYIDGFDFLRLLKEDLSTRHIPVCTISANNPETLPQKLGALDHIDKPIEPEALDRIFEIFEEVLKKSTSEVLVVEDDDEAQFALKTLLKGKGLNITQAKSGEQACVFVENQHFDCIVTDLRLPGMSGTELVRKLHQFDNCQITPIIVYTGKGLNAEECKVLNRYAVRVVMKANDSPVQLLDAVSLYLHRGVELLEESQQEAIHSLHDPYEALEGRKVLLVDDDVRNAFAMSKTLGDSKMNVTIADNGQLALEKLHSDTEFDIVLMDIMMPVMNGYEAIQTIRESQQFDALPIIALTAKGMSEDRDKAISSGANDYLTKPVDIDRLLAMMKMWLHNSRTRQLALQHHNPGEPVVPM